MEQNWLNLLHFRIDVTLRVLFRTPGNPARQVMAMYSIYLLYCSVRD